MTLTDIIKGGLGALHTECQDDTVELCVYCPGFWEQNPWSDKWVLAPLRGHPILYQQNKAGLYRFSSYIAKLPAEAHGSSAGISNDFNIIEIKVNGCKTYIDLDEAVTLADMAGVTIVVSDHYKFSL